MKGLLILTRVVIGFSSPLDLPAACPVLAVAAVDQRGVGAAPAVNPMLAKSCLLEVKHDAWRLPPTITVDFREAQEIERQ